MVMLEVIYAVLRISPDLWWHGRDHPARLQRHHQSRSGAAVPDLLQVYPIGEEHRTGRAPVRRPNGLCIGGVQI
jgi:hypothetical protein